MKNKIKLTDLSHLEPLNDKMAHLKGGDERGPLCFGCNCICTCGNPATAGSTVDSTHSSKNNGGWISNITTPGPVIIHMS
ncbi:MAG: TIGR04149 family rSAM-modified RiPP [Bacteroidales bacterium]|nr:TIGR04149 family rSAM-modified RiPP [Bacteroidales bacterium]